MLTGLLASTSCKEKSYNYEYHVVNDQPYDVVLKYTLEKNNVSYEEVVAPSTDTIIFLREEVTGNDIWDVEAAAQVYPFKSIVAYKMKTPIDTSKNLKLRKFWEGVSSVTKYGEEVGVYTLHLVDSVFIESVVIPEPEETQEPEEETTEPEEPENPEEEATEPEEPENPEEEATEPEEPQESEETPTEE